MSKSKAIKMTDIVLVKYLFKEDWAPLQDVVEKNSEQFGEVYEVSSEKELIEIVTASSATVVIASVSDKDQLGAVLGVLKNQRRVLKDSNTKFSVVNFLNNKQIETALMKLGCQEVMDPTMREKALKFKIDFWKKSLSVSQKKETDLSVTLAGKQNDAKEKTAGPANPISWIDALKCVDDMWLIKNPQDVKKVLTRWMVKVVGPSPYVAQWIEVPGQRGVWKFTFKDGIRETFHSADGDWIFKGEQKPEFVWKENLWMISGLNYQLYYQDEDEIVSRFRASPQAVEVSKNSSYALSRETTIVESFDQDILVKKGLKIDDTKTQIEQEEKGEGELTQDLSDQKPIETHYKNGVKSELPDAPEELKKHKVDSSTAPRLKGKSATDNLGSGQYQGDVEDGSKRASEQAKHASAADRMGDADGNAGTEDVGLAKYKGKLEHEHTSRKSEYGGDGETDDLGPDHWSNKERSQATEPRTPKERAEREAKAEREKKTAGPAQERTFQEKKQGGGYGGDGETEDLGSSHWSNKEKASAEEKAPREAAERKASDKIRPEKADAEERSAAASKDRAQKTEREKSDYEEKSAKGLKGQTKTDDLGDGHYSGASTKKNDKAAPVDKERSHLVELGASNEEKSAKEVAKEVELKAKRSQALGTDDLGASHYAGKVKREEPLTKEATESQTASKDAKATKDGARTSDYRDEKKKDYQGQSSTDDLGSSHYKGKASKATDVDEAPDELRGTKAEGAKKPAADKETKDVVAKRIRAVEDLLPEGDGEDPGEDVLPGDFEEAQRVDVPVQRPGPRLVVNNEKADRVKPEARAQTQTTKDKDPKQARDAEEQVEDEVLGDDGKPVTNDQAKVKAVLTCSSLGNVEHLVHVDDFFDKTVIVRMKKSPQMQETVNLVISFDYQKRNKRISVNGKCLEADQDSEGEYYATIELDPADLKVFEQFMMLYRLRQQHIHQFLKAAKGL